MPTKEEVQTYLNKIRPSLQADGGDVELVEIKDEKVYLRLQGHCRGCPMSQMTLKNGIQQFLNKELDPNLEVIGVD